MVLEIGECGAASERPFPVPHTRIVRVGSEDHQQPCAQRLVPVSRGAQLVVRSQREPRGNLAAAVGAIGISKDGQAGDAGKSLPEVLVGAVEPGHEGAAAGTLPVCPGHVAPQAGCVDLVGGSVGAGLVEAAAAAKQPEQAAITLDQEQAVLAVNVGGTIDRAALRRGFLDVPVGAESAAGSEQAPGAALGLREQAVIECAFGAVAGPQFAEILGGPRRDQADHAAHGAGAVEVAGAAAHQFDALDRQFGLLLPVNPPSYGVVQRHVVLGDQGAAGGGGTEAAQADALRGGVGHQGAGAPEQLDAGKLTQPSVEGDGSRGVECLERKDAGGRRAFERIEGRAIGGDGHLLGAGRRLKPQGGPGVQHQGLGGKPLGGDAQMAGSGAANGQAAIGVGASEKLPAGALDGRSVKCRAAAIFNGDGQSHQGPGHRGLGRKVRRDRQHNGQRANRHFECEPRHGFRSWICCSECAAIVTRFRSGWQ